VINRRNFMPIKREASRSVNQARGEQGKGHRERDGEKRGSGESDQKRVTKTASNSIRGKTRRGFGGPKGSSKPDREVGQNSRTSWYSSTTGQHTGLDERGALRGSCIKKKHAQKEERGQRRALVTSSGGSSQNRPDGSNLVSYT